MRYEHIEHGIPPVFNAESRVLILGTMPSPKSRENGFYYMHPQNRFWRVISTVLGEPLPTTNGERASLLLKNKIALWDTLAQCDIIGASDCSVKNETPNDLSVITDTADIKAIFTTGKTAYKYYCRFQQEKTGIEAICLPSTSPANARFGLDALIDEYKIIKNYL
ncbi:MAG: DNA-deoxyinosine glycosylase [Eubacterium sp.]|nr:DNA-deoxyinosine glycosylase [Eubacterium sp.]